MDLNKIIKGAKDPEKVKSVDVDPAKESSDLTDPRTISGKDKSDEYKQVK